jgi:hypothetical protein
MRSDPWDGLDSILRPGEEVLIARTHEDVVGYLRSIPVDSASASALCLAGDCLISAQSRSGW